MSQTQLPEVWLRGPIEGVPALLQPIAHALMQAREEIHALLQDFPETLLWEKPAGVASVGFHLQHLKGVLDRLFTYAKGEALSREQLDYLSKEGKGDENIRLAGLIAAWDAQVDDAIVQLTNTDANGVMEPRGVGRKQLPSTVLGLLFHAAEHTMRHTGQLVVTVGVLKGVGK